MDKIDHNSNTNSVRVCDKHKYPIHHINIYDNASKPLHCIRCAKEKRIKLDDLLHFSELLDEDNNTLLMNFPPLEESVQQRMNDVSNLSDKNEGILQNIENYFNNLTKEIERHISSAKNQAKGKAIKFLKSNEEIFIKYNEICFRKQLRQILKDGGENMESRVSEILRSLTKEEHIKQNSKILSECLDSNKMWRECVNFSIPKKIQDAVLNMLSQIDFFSNVSEQPLGDSLKLNQLLMHEENNPNQNCNLLIDLIGSKANFCSQEFLQSTKKMIEELKCFINSYSLGENPYEAEHRNVFQKLNANQMNELAKLSQKIATTSEAYVRQNISEGDIAEDIQPKTYSFLKYSEKLISNQDQKTLKLLLKSFPILELSPLTAFVFDNSILNQVNLIKSQYDASQQLIISKKLNNGQLVMENPGSGSRQCYCDFILDKAKSYIFRLSISQTTNNDSNFLVFGLQPDSSKDSSYLYSHRMSYCERGDNYGMQKEVRGGQIHKGNGQPVNREFEMRICLEKKILQVSDYPNYSNVCEIDDTNKIKSDVQYRFGMESFNKSKMTITEIIKADELDKKI